MRATTLAAALRGTLPAYVRELPDSAPGHQDALGPEQGFLEFVVAAEPAQRTACGNDAMCGHAAIATATHDVPHGP